MRLRIVEFADELQDYKYLEDEKIIALNPCSQSFLKKRKIKFENSLNFFGKEGHLSILRQSKKIMDNVKKFNNFYDKNNLSKSYTGGIDYYLTFYVRYMLILLYIVDKAIKKYNPKEIVVANSTLIENFSYSWSEKDRLLGYLVKKYVKENNLTIKIIEEKKRKNTFSFNFLFLSKFLKKITFYISYFVFKYLFVKKNIYIITDDKNNLDNIVRKIKIEKPELKPVFLNLSFEGNKKYSFDILKGSAFNLFFNSFLSNKKEIKSIKENLKKITSELYKNNALNREIAFFNVDLVEELNIFITHVMFKALKELNAQIYFLVKIIKISNPKFMISQHAHLIGCAFSELSKIHNIPTIVFSHGSLVSHESDVVKHEWQNTANMLVNKNFTYIAAQSPNMLKFLKDNEYTNNQIIVTGPQLFNKITSSREEVNNLKKIIFKKYKDKKIILHAGSPKLRGSNRLLVYETVDEYIKNINDMIAVIEKKNDVFFAIRYRDNPRISLRDFKELIKESEHCKVCHEGNFTDFLSVADLMISYASTTIDEALYNRVPTLLFDPDNKYSYIKASKIYEDTSDLKDGIFYCSKLEELNFNIDKILENKDKIKNDSNIWKRHILDTDSKKSWLLHLIN